MDLRQCTQSLDGFISNQLQLMNVVVVQSDVDQRHCGIVYKYDGKCNLLHLAWHHLLLHETDITSFNNYCHIISQLDEYRQYAVCAMCDLIKDNPDIPYGIYYNSTVFTKDGKLQLAEGEVGLTCATFVLAVFKSCQLNLIDISTWRSRDDDRVFHEKILNGLTTGMSCGRVSKQHFEAVRKDIGCARFRPEEVAVSSGFNVEDMPVCLDMLEGIALNLGNRVQAKYIPAK